MFRYVLDRHNKQSLVVSAHKVVAIGEKANQVADMFKNWENLVCTCLDLVVI